MKLALVFAAVFTAAVAQADQSMDELRRLVREAARAGTNRVVIPPGIYRGAPEKGSKVHLWLRKVSNLEIVADGVTMICTEPTRAIDFNSCTNVTLRGITVDYDPLPFTQGDVVGVNPVEGWMDVKIHAGYPRSPYTRVDIVDRQTRYRKRDKPFMWESKAELREGGIVRVLNKGAARFAQPGDLASLGGELPNVVAHAVVADDSSEITFENVTVHSSNCMGLLTAGGDGGHRFLRCRVVPGPVPQGGTEPRILSTTADAMLTSSMRKGALTEGCEIRDAGDDSWSVQSSDYVILKREGRTLYLGARDMLALRTGDRLQASVGGALATITNRTVMRRKEVTLSETIIEKLKRGAAWRWSYWHVGGGSENGPVCKVMLDADVPWNEGDSVYDLDRQGNGFVFRNNRVRSSGRILIKASGVVEENHIEGPFAISVLPEVPFPAAAGIASIVIRSNTIIDAHMFNPFPDSPQAGAISVTGGEGAKNEFRPAGVYGKVLIENNTIRGGNGAGIVVSSAREVMIRGNRLVDLLQVAPNSTGRKYRIDNHAAIWMAHCDMVVLAGNELLNPGSEMSQPLVLGPGVQSVEGRLIPQRP